MSFPFHGSSLNSETKIPNATQTSIGIPDILPDTSHIAMQLLNFPFLARSSTIFFSTAARQPQKPPRLAHCNDLIDLMGKQCPGCNLCLPGLHLPKYTPLATPMPYAKAQELVFSVCPSPYKHNVPPFKPSYSVLAGPPHSPEVTDQLQSGQGIVGPRHIDPPDQIRERHVRNHVEEEVQSMGFPVERNVAEPFSVKPIKGFGFELNRLGFV
nr:hypothetical protein Iba_chr12eCG0090 [Ipomoea batatas]